MFYLWQVIHNYDPNIFVNGISYEDYKDLQPKNKNDVLAPNPQVNLATQGVFQPGSTFKMVTGMAAIDQGLSPHYAIQDHWSNKIRWS